MLCPSERAATNTGAVNAVPTAAVAAPNASADQPTQRGRLERTTAGTASAHPITPRTARRKLDAAAIIGTYASVPAPMGGNTARAEPAAARPLNIRPTAAREVRKRKVSS
jgi:hypothetical protein